MSIAIEVLEHRATREIVHVETQLRCDVEETVERLVGGKRLRRNAPRIGDSLRIAAERHVRQIQEPACRQVLAVVLEDTQQLGNRQRRSFGIHVHPAVGDRHQTGVDGVMGDAVLLLAQPDVAHREQLPQVDDHLGAFGVASIVQRLEELDGQVDRIPRAARAEQLVGLLILEVEATAAFGLCSDADVQCSDTLVVEKRILVGISVARRGRQDLWHGPVVSRNDPCGRGQLGPVRRPGLAARNALPVAA